MGNTMLDAAIELASKGLAVFPLVPRDKKPLSEHGCKDATTNVDQVKKWWSTNPNANIGIACGRASGNLLAIDLDIKEDGTNGFDELAAWERENGELPETVRSITGKGGSHILFRTEGSFGNRTGLLPAIDIRGENGYIVAPPSIHPNGNRYQWEYDPEEYPILEADETVYKLLSYGSEKKSSFSLPTDKIPDGERNTTIHKLACSLQAKGLSDESIYLSCQSENKLRCSPPLESDEVDKIVASALKYNKGSLTQEHRTTKKVIVSSVEDIEEIDVEWLIDDVLPTGQITIIGGDGGTGKGFLACNILAGLTTGKPCMLEDQVDRIGNDYSYLTVRDPKTVLYLSGEDTFEITIRKRLRAAGADLSRIYTMNFTSQLDARISTSSVALEEVVSTYKPDLLVLDPLESFIDVSVRMGDRNSMRQALKPLLKYGEKYNLTTLLIAHANKGKGSWGRKRLADSSDLWDHARSVFLTGWTPDKHFYISHEKSNYCMRTKTIEYEIADGKATFVKYSDWSDKEYVLAGAWDAQGKSSRTDAKDFIIDTLQEYGEPMPVKDLDELASAVGYAATTLKRAKTELKKDAKIKFFNKGYAKEKQFFIELL